MHYVSYGRADPVVQGVKDARIPIVIPVVDNDITLPLS